MDLATVNASSGEWNEVRISYSDADDIPLGITLFIVPAELEMLGINPEQEDAVEYKIDSNELHIKPKDG